MLTLKIEDRIRLEEQFISQNQKLSVLTDEEKQNFIILDENIKKSISESIYSDVRRFVKSFPEIIDLLGIEKVVEIMEPLYNWERNKLLKDQYICISLLDNLHILFSACKGWCGGADDISEIPDIEEGHDIFKNEDVREMSNDKGIIQSGKNTVCSSL